MRASALWRAVPAVRDGHVLIVDESLMAPSVPARDAAVRWPRLIHPGSVHDRCPPRAGSCLWRRSLPRPCSRSRVGTIARSPISALWDALSGTSDSMPAMVVRTLAPAARDAGDTRRCGTRHVRRGAAGHAAESARRTLPARRVRRRGRWRGDRDHAARSARRSCRSRRSPERSSRSSLRSVVARAAGARGDPRVLLMAGVVVGAFANAAIMVMLAQRRANTVRERAVVDDGSVVDATWRADRGACGIHRGRRRGARRARTRDRHTRTW